MVEPMPQWPWTRRSPHRRCLDILPHTGDHIGSFSSQGGSFDVADRMFHSVKNAWESASRENMSDVRELTPEFFYLPEFLINCNAVEFGAWRPWCGRGGLGRDHRPLHPEAQVVTSIISNFAGQLNEQALRQTSVAVVRAPLDGGTQ